MASQLKPISEQVVVITGASSGIGLAAAYEFAKKGARVLLVARNRAALQAIVQKIEAGGGEASYAVADVSKVADLEAVAQTAIKTFGGFDTWVNNAGIGAFGRLDEISDEDHRRIFDVNFWGLVYGSKIAAAHMADKGGAIINLGSVASDIALPMQGMYAASKHAIKGFTDALRMELLEEGSPISVTLIKPATINTPFPAHAKNYLPREPKLPPPIYQPEDVSAAIVYAAEHGGRDYYVGGGGKLMSAINKAVPGAVDWVGAKLMAPMTMTNDPPNPARGNGAMYAAGVDGDVHGESPHHVMTSVMTRAATKPLLSSALLLGAGLAATALFAARRANS